MRYSVLDFLLGLRSEEFIIHGSSDHQIDMTRVTESYSLMTLLSMDNVNSDSSTWEPSPECGYAAFRFLLELMTQLKLSIADSESDVKVGVNESITSPVFNLDCDQVIAERKNICLSHLKHTWESALRDCNELKGIIAESNASRDEVIFDVKSAIGDIAQNILSIFFNVSEDIATLLGPVLIATLRFYSLLKEFDCSSSDIGILIKSINQVLGYIHDMSFHREYFTTNSPVAIHILCFFSLLSTLNSTICNLNKGNNINQESTRSELAKLALLMKYTRTALCLHAKELSQGPDCAHFKSFYKFSNVSFPFPEEDIFARDICQHSKNVIPDSRIWLHEIVNEWVDNKETKILFLLAEPGMGKSAFTVSLIKKLRYTNNIAGYFYCNSNDKSRTSGEAIILNISKQITTFYPECKDLICQAMNEMKASYKSLEEKLNLLVITPLNNADLSRRINNTSAVIVVDGIDEIDGASSSGRSDMLKVLTLCAKLLPDWVKLLVTSRPGSEVIEVFYRFSSVSICINRKEHEDDLIDFISHKLKGHVDPNDYKDAVDILYEKSMGLFVYVVSILDEEFAQSNIFFSLNDLKALPRGIDELYLNCFCKAIENENDEKTLVLVKILTVMMEPIRLIDAQTLLGFTHEDMDMIATKLKRVFPIIGESYERRFTVYHQTVLEWLFNKSKSRRGYVDEQWLKDALNMPLQDTSIKRFNVLLKLREAGFSRISDFLKLNIDQWNPSVLPLTILQISHLREYFEKERKINAKSNHKFVVYDFSVDKRSAHELFCDNLNRILIGYVPNSTSSIHYSVTDLPGTGYMFKYVVDHLIRAGELYIGDRESSERRFNEAKILILHFDWLIESIKNRPGGILDFDSDFKLCSDSTSSFDFLVKDFELLSRIFAVTSLKVSASTAIDYQIRALVLSLIGCIRPLVEKRSEGVYAERLLQRSVAWWEDNVSYFPHVYELDDPRSVSKLVMDGHSDTVNMLCMTADGRKAVSGSADKSIRVWNLESGECERILYGHTKAVTSVFITSDGFKIVSGSLDMCVKIWDLSTGSCDRALYENPYFSELVCLADSDTAVSASCDGSIKFWNLETGRCERIFNDHKESVLTVCLARDCKTMASGSEDRSIRVWNVDALECSKTLLGHSSPLLSVCTTPDSKKLISASNTSIKVWNLATSELLVDISREQYQSVTCLASFHDNRSFVFGSIDGSISIHDLFTGECKDTWIGHYSSVTSLCVSQTGHKIVSGSADRSVRRWDLTQKYDTALCEHSSEVVALFITPDHRKVVSGSNDASVKVWDIASKSCERVLTGHRFSVASMSTSSGTFKIVSTSWDGVTIKLWDLNTGESEDTLIRHPHSVESALITRNGSKIVTSSSFDTSIRLWDISTGECERVMTGLTSSLTVLCITPDDKRVASGARDGTVKLWNLSTGECERTLTGHKNNVKLLSTTPDCARIVSGAYKTVKIWKLSTGECLRTITEQAAIRSLCITPCGKRILSTTRRPDMIRVWDIESGVCLSEKRDKNSEDLELVMLISAVGIEVTALQAVEGMITFATPDHRVSVFVLNSKAAEISQPPSPVSVTQNSMSKSFFAFFGVGSQ